LIILLLPVAAAVVYLAAVAVQVDLEQELAFLLLRAVLTQ
jgi:hypothetical protein